MLVELGILSYKHLILFFFPLFIKIESLLMVQKSVLDQNYMYRIFNEYLSMSICGLTIHLIVKYYYKTRKEKENEQYHKQKTKELEILEDSVRSGEKNMSQFQIIALETIHNKRSERKKQYCFLLLITFIQVFGLLVQFYFTGLITTKNKQIYKNISILVLSIFFILFSILFLHFSLHRHQFFSLGIMFFCLIIFISQTIIYKENVTFKDVLYYFLRLCIFDSFLCLTDVLGKKYLNTYMDDVYLFIFKLGLMGGIPFLIYDIISYNYDIDKKYYGIISAIVKQEVPFTDFLIKFISSSIFDLGIWLIIYHFSPCHFLIYDIATEFFDIIYIIIQNNENDLYDSAYELEQKITFIILYPFLIFGILVFNEILIINVCSLQYNTKKYISKREKKEEIEEENRDSFCSNDILESSLVEYNKNE